MRAGAWDAVMLANLENSALLCVFSVSAFIRETI